MMNEYLAHVLAHRVAQWELGVGPNLEAPHSHEEEHAELPDASLMFFAGLPGMEIDGEFAKNVYELKSQGEGASWCLPDVTLASGPRCKPVEGLEHFEAWIRRAYAKLVEITVEEWEAQGGSPSVEKAA